jgi:hypothetical protein
MDRIIRVIIKEVYGKSLIYPVNFQNEIESLTGAKTLNHRHITALKNLGLRVITQNLEIEF